MKIRENIQALDAPVLNFSREAHFVVSNPGHREFFHISPALITSSANKRGGVKKYIDTDSVGSVKNHNQRPAYLFGEVISDAKSGKTFIVILNFGNYEAGAN